MDCVTKNLLLSYIGLSHGGVFVRLDTQSPFLSGNIQMSCYLEYF